MNEVEINIKGAFFYILGKWKLILAGGIIGAIAIGGLQTAREANGDSVVAESPSIIDIDDAEREFVDSVYSNLNSLKQLNEERKESLIMNIDPENAAHGEVTYMIRTANPENIGGIIQAYGQSLSGLEFKYYLVEKTGLTDSDVNETVFLSYGQVGYVTTSSAIDVRILSDDEDNARKVLSAVKDYITDKSNGINQIGFEHDLLLLNESVYCGYDSDVLASQAKYMSEIQSRNIAVIETENGLKGNQKAYYESLTSSGDFTLSGPSSVGANQDYTGIHISVKYLLLGIFVGIFLVCGVLFVLYVVLNKVDEDDDVEKMYNTSLLGVIPGEDYGKFLYRIKHIGKRTFDLENSIELVSTRIGVLATKSNSKKIGIVGCGIMKHSEKAVSVLTDSLKKLGFESVVIDDPLYSSAAVEKLETVDSVVIFEKIGMTYRDEVWREKELIEKICKNLEGIILAG